MCGIAGIINYKGKAIDRGIVKKMCDSMRHRGPDNEGIYLTVKGDYSVALGHRRLSVIDLVSGNQPIFNEDKTIVIVCNGEIYDFKELRADLEKRGHSFQSNSDTEVIAHLYEDYGQECLKYLRGPFALAIWDNKNNRLFLARDRIGKKPLIYTLKNGSLIFASEFKALLSHPDVAKEIDFEAVDAYLSYGYVPAPLSIYKGIYKLMPGHYLIFENNNIKTEKYWSLNFRNKVDLNEEELCVQVRHRVSEAVAIRMISDVPLGAFLSGGIDSSIVVGLMSQLSSQKIRTFSIGFPEKEYNELNYARIVAKRFNTDHQELVVKPDIEEVLPILAEHYGEPYADSSAVPSYYLAKLTRSRMIVALNGDGGDELFAGYQRHWANRLACLGLIRLYLRYGGGYAFNKLIPDALHPKSFFARLKRFSQAAIKKPSLRYSEWVGFLSEDLKKKLYNPAFQDAVDPFIASSRLDDIFKEAEGLDPVDTFLYADTLFNLPNDLLVKMDIACMANSLEGRSPFLDHKLMEFTASIPSKYKLKGNVSKYILKKAFKNLLPGEIFKRGKMGFALPIGFWFRGELKEFVERVLLTEKSLKRGYFNSSGIKELLEQHFSAKKDYTFQIWALLMLELWHKSFVD
jgi:asparagine synthase (glutamine-hydrolysing)